MKIAVRYFTRTGNTRKLAEAIAQAVGTTAHDVSVPLSEDTDILFLGSSVYAGGADASVMSFISNNAKNIKKLVNFSTAAVLRSTYNQIKKAAEHNGVLMADEEFHCRGSFMIMHRNRPDAKDLQKAAEFAKSVIKH